MTIVGLTDIGNITINHFDVLKIAISDMSVGSNMIPSP